MKGQKCKLVTIGAILFFILASSPVYASIVCYMTVTKVGSRVLATGAANSIRAKSQTSCGTMEVGDKRTFYFADTIGDAGLAVGMLALTLGERVRLVLVNNDAQDGSTVESIQLDAPIN